MTVRDNTHPSRDLAASITDERATAATPSVGASRWRGRVRVVLVR
jgi:hypothetical protein